MNAGTEFDGQNSVFYVIYVLHILKLGCLFILLVVDMAIWFFSLGFS